MSEPRIPREVLDHASKISPEDFGRLGLYLARLTRAFAAMGIPTPTTASDARQRLRQAADILAEDPSQGEVVGALRTAARDFDDNDALRFCRDGANKFSNQADALRKTLEVVAAHKTHSQKKPWWKLW